MNLEPLLRGRFGRPFRWVEETETTQALLSADDPEGAVAAADHQTAGRGRLGRQWTAPPGTAITASVLLCPPAGAPVQQLSLVAGLAVAETVEAALDLSAQIKWPNDVMVDRRKIAGILAEARDGIGSRDFLRGRRVSVDGRDGVAGGLDREGRLLVDGVAVVSGDVSL